MRKNVQSAQDWEDQNAGGGVINVHGAEASQLNDTTVYVIHYLLILNLLVPSLNHVFTQRQLQTKFLLSFGLDV